MGKGMTPKVACVAQNVSEIEVNVTLSKKSMVSYLHREILLL